MDKNNSTCSFNPDTVYDKENIDFNRGATDATPGWTPTRPRLRKFVDVYSPEHLNLTPKNKQKLEFNVKSNIRNESPDWFTSENYRQRQSPYKCRTVKAQPRLRHVLSNCSFEGNQSFPRLSHKVRPIKMELETPTKIKPVADYVRVDGPNGLRFNTSLASEDYVGSPGQSQTDRLQQTVNPSKAVFTIEPNTTKILIVNNKACSLLGYSSGELCGLSFSELLHSRSNRTFKLQELEDPDSSEERPLVLLSGKVVELLSKDGSTVQVSLWIRQLDNEGPCLVVAEPVSCINAKLLVEAESGVVAWGGEQAGLLFQAEGGAGEQLAGRAVAHLVPSIRLPSPAAADKLYKQKATGRTLDGSSFPLCLWISKADSADLSLISTKYKDKVILEVNIRVTYNVSGLLVVDAGGVVTACNPHFALLTFGAPHHEVVGQPVERLLRGFCRPADLLPPAPRPSTPPPRGSDTDDDSCGAFNGSQKSACMSPNVQPSLVSAACDKSSSALCLDKSSSALCLDKSSSALCLDKSSSALCLDKSSSALCLDKSSSALCLDKSSSALCLDKSSSALCLDKSSSALCLDKSCGLVTHTPTPTQDMVSSISTTEQRNDLSALPDVTSAISGISIDDDNYCPSLSKSRSENILRSEQSHPSRTTKPSEKSDSIYYTSQHSQELTPTGGAPRVRVTDPSLRLSFDSSKYKSLKNNAGGRDDRSSVSLELCDSNETSADFLTPINEMPPAGDPAPPDLPELSDMRARNGTDSADSFYDNDLDSHLTHTESVPRKKYDDEPETPCAARRLVRNHMTTSTPARRRDCDCGDDCTRDCARDGTYRGTLLHRDGTELNVIYTVSSMTSSTGARVRYVWVRVCQEPPAASSHASTADTDLPTGNKSASSRPASMSLASQCGEEQLAGEYSRHYVTLKQIGKGAYGCVKMAYRRSDRLLVVTKFILKEKVGAQFWVDAPDGRRVPLELSLLLTLNHPHIVSVVDAFENDKYFQMVMEKHGAGMDLFEFIERRPRLDEPLLSYIFRQIGQAVEYLHGLHILHRDVKDENVIIDGRFHVKLIDFGSATFMSRDSLFSTFYGTTEYCSPEVLAGNKYAGPELEMWSMGITLYVLTFFVNPFSDIEDTIQGPLALPHPVSDELEHLLRWMLHKEAAARCSVAQLMAHAWITQPVAIHHYCFADVVDCDRHEANPAMYYSGSPESGSGSGSPVSLAEHHAKESWRERECAGGGEGGAAGSGSGAGAGGSVAWGVRGARSFAAPAPTVDPASDNYSLRSSADILDISSKPVSEAALTDISSDATGHAACDIACDCGREHACDCGREHARAPDPDLDALDAYANDSWASDIVDQDSFS